MKLSIVIVNYNVKYFLEQCLNSVLEAIKSIETEVWVVDNNSVDGSCSMLKEKFPNVKLIENKENTGFSYANNQAIKQSIGEYILLLNPDTIVKEDTFQKCIAFMDEHKEAGGLGVKMLDGKGNFLPESKRALPSPLVAFYKIFGLSTLFPKSKRFSKYHLGYLDKNKTHEVEILAGAYMFLRKSVLDKIGLLDDTFFMYGEDIDLSYRIILGGYKNYYFPETQILHYKGESTKKGSVNYVLVFYNAMIIFAKKHFSKKNAKLFSFLIKTAIFFRAGLAIIHRIFKKTIVPLSDAIFIYLGFFISSHIWQQIKFETIVYSNLFQFIILPAYSIFTIVTFYFSGVYDKSKSLLNLFKGLIYGIIGLFILYALLPENLRFSRAVILLGSVWMLTVIPLYRIFFETIGLSIFKIQKSKRKKTAIIADFEESERILKLIKQTKLPVDYIGNICPSDQVSTKDFLGDLNQLEEIIRINKLDELIFSSENISSKRIIELMLDHAHLNIDYKIVPLGSNSIIGSNSIDTINDIYYLNINSIDKEKNQRLKRLTDLYISIIAIVILPIAIFTKKPFRKIANIFLAILGKRTWVSYAEDDNARNLPKLKQGIYSTAQMKKKSHLSIDELNLNYAKDYRMTNDILIFFNNFLH